MHVIIFKKIGTNKKTASAPTREALRLITFLVAIHEIKAKSVCVCVHLEQRILEIKQFGRKIALLVVTLIVHDIDLT